MWSWIRFAVEVVGWLAIAITLLNTIGPRVEWWYRHWWILRKPRDWPKD